MIWIKICGITTLEDALAAADAGADAVGFVFAGGPKHIEPSAAAEITAQLPAEVEKVGVFVNEQPARIHEIVKQAGLTGVQLNGDEPKQYAERLFPPAEAGRPLLYRALSLKTMFSAANLTSFLRLDRPTTLFQAVLVNSGSEKAFDWERARPFIATIKRNAKVAVGGGLTAENVGRAIGMFDPWGVNVCSGVEKSPGRKDHAKMKAFVAAVRKKSGQ
jgi:phosphoribosylanthranilate isomerase